MIVLIEFHASLLALAIRMVRRHIKDAYKCTKTISIHHDQKTGFACDKPSKNPIKGPLNTTKSNRHKGGWVKIPSVLVRANLLDRRIRAQLNCYVAHHA